MSQLVMIEEAKRLHIQFTGMQERLSGQVPLPTFYDSLTKSTFLVHENETIEQALNRIRKPFLEVSQ